MGFRLGWVGILEQTIARRLTGSQWLPGPRVVSLVGVVSCNRVVSLLLSLSFSLSLSLSLSFPLSLSVYLSLDAYPFFLSFHLLPSHPTVLPSPSFLFRGLYLSPDVSSSFCHNDRFFRSPLPLSVIVRLVSTKASIAGYSSLRRATADE